MELSGSRYCETSANDAWKCLVKESGPGTDGVKYFLTTRELTQLATYFRPVFHPRQTETLIIRIAEFLSEFRELRISIFGSTFREFFGRLGIYVSCSENLENIYSE